jgi:hypothetical protein
VSIWAKHLGVIWACLRVSVPRVFELCGFDHPGRKLILVCFQSRPETYSCCIVICFLSSFKCFAYFLYEVVIARFRVIGSLVLLARVTGFVISVGCVDEFGHELCTLAFRFGDGNLRFSVSNC